MYRTPHRSCDRESEFYAWNVTSKIFTIPSAPALASFASSNQKTELMLPAATFLIAMFFIGFATLQT